MAFKPGQSGNPNGRPKVDFEVRDLARRHGSEAIQKLVELMRGDNASLAKAAAEALLDRGFGRPIQAVGVDQESSPIQGISVTFVGAPAEGGYE